MNRSPSITQLLTRWRGGDEDAAQVLFDRYARRLAALAEKNLSRKLARRVDGDDIVQSVFRTFFARSARGEFRIGDSVDIWQLLVTITLAKVRSEARRHTADKRDVNAESPAGLEKWLPEAINSEPGPAEAAALVDQIESLLDGLPDDYSEILSMRLEGRSRSEIAERIGITRQTVSRVLGVMQHRLQRDFAG